MATCYLAHVTSLSEDIIGFQCVPSPSSFDGTVDYDRPGIRGWLTEEGWKVKCFENYLTGDSSFPPSCFSLAKEITDALDQGREKIRGSEGKLFGGTASVRVYMNVRATGESAKALKENEAEEAIAGAYDSNFALRGTFIPEVKHA